MPLKLSPVCNICKVIAAGDEELVVRLYNSSHFKGKKGELLSKIQKDYNDKFSYRSFLGHFSKHQFFSEKNAQQAGIQHLNDQTVNKAIKEMYDHNAARQLIIDKGTRQIRQGKIKLKASDVRAAAKDQADIEEKQKDRQVQVMEMILKVASGEVTSGLIGAASSPGQARTVVSSTT